MIRQPALLPARLLATRLPKAPAAPQPTPSPPANTDIESTYQKKTPVAHVLLRPGMYIGSVRLEKFDAVWRYDSSLCRMRLSEVAYNPGLVKIFDEILVNACDNVVRDPSMTRLDVTIDCSSTGKLSVSVENDGRGIPVALHKTEGVYVPELVLGTLLTGSNFDESPRGGSGSAAASSASTPGRTTGGLHGYGAKLTNIFSTTFSVDTVDAAVGLRYTQTWRNNMSVVEAPVIAPAPARTPDYTRITFCPDLARFYVDSARSSSSVGVDAGTLTVMRRRVVDAAGLLAGSGVRVSLNGALIDVGSFLGYAGLYGPRAGTPTPPVTGATARQPAAARAVSKRGKPAALAAADAPPSPAASPADVLVNQLRHVTGPTCHAAVPLGRRWDIAVGIAGLPTAGLEPPADPSTAADLAVCNAPGVVASFVNGMTTPQGGSHAALVSDLICRRLAPFLHKRVAAILAAAASETFTPPSSAAVVAAVTPALLRSHLRLWVHARVASPSFDSQSKERLVTPARDLVSQLARLVQTTPVAATAAGEDAAAALDDAAALALGLTDKFLRGLSAESGLVEAVAGGLRARAELDSARSLRKAVKALGPASQVRATPKLEDANLAGGRRAHECTLILTEGDSAKALAMAGLAVLGRDRYGIFPLRGKLLNVRDVSPVAALASAEVAAIVSILGLEVGRSYAGVPPEQRGLRYGRVMVMADQDVDGSHIKGAGGQQGGAQRERRHTSPPPPPAGLIVNLLHTFWPSLIAAEASPPSSPSSSDPPPFVEQFITPVIKARRGAALREFFSVRQFEAWREEGRQRALQEAAGGTFTPPPPAADGRAFGEASVGRWAVKYFKGLGTSTAAEGRGYFSDLDRHRRPFVWGGPADGDRLAMAFSKDRADERKVWLEAQAADEAAAAVANAAAGAPGVPGGPPPGDAAAAEAAANAAAAPDYHSLASVSFSDFVDRELIDFSRAVSRVCLRGAGECSQAPPPSPPSPPHRRTSCAPSRACWTA